MPPYSSKAVATLTAFDITIFGSQPQLLSLPEWSMRSSAPQDQGLHHHSKFQLINSHLLPLPPVWPIPLFENIHLTPPSVATLNTGHTPQHSTSSNTPAPSSQPPPYLQPWIPQLIQATMSRSTRKTNLTRRCGKTTGKRITVSRSDSRSWPEDLRMKSA